MEVSVLVVEFTADCLRTIMMCECHVFEVGAVP